MSDYEKHHPHHQGPPGWETWDWNSILRGTLLFVFGILLFWSLSNGPDFLNKYREKKLDAIATAKIIEVKKDVNMYQGLTGNSMPRTVNIIVHYKFVAKGIVYEGQEMIPSDDNTEGYIPYLLNGPGTDIQIKYSSKDPSKSQIVIP